MPQAAKAAAPSILLPPPCDHLIALRHSCAHALAMAVQTLYPEVKVATGPLDGHRILL